MITILWFQHGIWATRCDPEFLIFRWMNSTFTVHPKFRISITFFWCKFWLNWRYQASLEGSAIMSHHRTLLHLPHAFNNLAAMCCRVRLLPVTFFGEILYITFLALCEFSGYINFFFKVFNWKCGLLWYCRACITPFAPCFVFVPILSRNPIITSEKFCGSQNYQSWSNTIDLWFMGQGVVDHLKNRVEDVPKNENGSLGKGGCSTMQSSMIVSFLKISSTVQSFKGMCWGLESSKILIH